MWKVITQNDSRYSKIILRSCLYSQVGQSTLPREKDPSDILFGWNLVTQWGEYSAPLILDWKIIKSNHIQLLGQHVQRNHVHALNAITKTCFPSELKNSKMSLGSFCCGRTVNRQSLTFSNLFLLTRQLIIQHSIHLLL